MNQRIFHLLLCLLILLACACGMASARANPWKNPPNPLKIEGPGGNLIEMVPVYLGISGGLLGTLEFTAGTPGKTPEETPTLTTVGGVFQNEKGEWFYYLGNTEVTRGLYNAVMRESGLPEAVWEGERDFPATNLSWFDIQNFLRALNEWLAKNPAAVAGGDVPPGVFLRLPTEGEWEFAARGGTRAGRELFDAATPYPADSIHKYEWVAGPSSSHNKLNPVRRLLPNPLGLHDMLGNASELTASFFQIEPGQGAAGGISRRGGNFRARAADLRASLRGEFVLFDEDGNANRSPDTGFRLALGGPVFSGIERVREVQAGWERHRASRIVPLPDNRRGEPVSEALSREENREAPSADAGSEQEIQSLRSRVQDLAARSARHEKTSAETIVRVLSLNAHVIGKSAATLRKLDFGEPVDRPVKAAFEVVLNDPDITPAISSKVKKIERPFSDLITYFHRQRVTLASEELRNARQVYLHSMELAAGLTPSLIESAFQTRLSELLLEQGAQSQIRTTDAALAQWRGFLQSRRADLPGWTSALEKAYEEDPR